DLDGAQVHQNRRLTVRTDALHRVVAHERSVLVGRLVVVVEPELEDAGIASLLLFDLEALEVELGVRRSPLGRGPGRSTPPAELLTAAGDLCEGLAGGLLLGGLLRAAVPHAELLAVDD